MEQWPPVGFHELAAFMSQESDPATDLVVQTIEAVDPELVKVERLEFAYYPQREFEVTPMADSP